MRFEDISNEEVKAFNAYADDKEALPVGIIREHFFTKKLTFQTQFDWVLPTAQQMTEIAKFMVEHDS
jgi:hypothetical protein